MSNLPNRPGWYPSETVGLERYWNGKTWSNRLRLTPTYVNGKPVYAKEGSDAGNALVVAFFLVMMASFLAFFLIAILLLNVAILPVTLAVIVVLAIVLALAVKFFLNAHTIKKQIKALQNK